MNLYAERIYKIADLHSFHELSFCMVPKVYIGDLVGAVRDRLESLIREKVEQLGCKVIALTIGEDHAHLFVQANPKLSPNTIIGQVKGCTSRILRKEFPELRRRLPTLWTRSYFVSTHGHMSDETTQRYIEEQKGM